MTPYHDERRASPRCDVVKNRSSIEFAAPEGRRRIGATLVNISRDGALVVADKPMRRAAPLSLRIESPVRTDWVDASVVRFERTREIALHFPKGCPDDLLLAGTVGIDIAFLVRNEANGTTAFD
jgi:PilZ domain